MDRQECLRRLGRRVWLYAAFGAALLLVQWAWLSLEWPGATAGRWLLQAGLAFLYPLWTLARNLETNHRAGSADLFPDLGPGNLASLLRGALLAALAGFLFLPPPPGWPDWRQPLAWLPGLLYSLAAALDALDGALARRSNRLTVLGERLDMSLDGLGVLIAAGLVVQYNQAPGWFLLVGLARYLYLLGSWLRTRRGLALFELPYSFLRLLSAGMMMGFLGIVLWPIFRPPGTHLAALAWAAPFLFGFGRDWLIASGRLPQSLPAAWLRRLEQLSAWLWGWLPLALRGLVLAAGLWGLIGAPSSSPRFWLGLWQAPAALLVGLGIGVRWLGVVLLMALGVWQHFAPLDGLQQGLMVVYTILIFLGGGPRWTLWQPEERYVHRKSGGK